CQGNLKSILREVLNEIGIWEGSGVRGAVREEDPSGQPRHAASESQPQSDRPVARHYDVRARASQVGHKSWRHGYCLDFIRHGGTPDHGCKPAETWSVAPQDADDMLAS
ncbi:MAG TPA: hypothetical protein VGA62_08420, partial [Acidimicrobiia bacterium]